MFQFLCDSSSGSRELCLTEITRSRPYRTHTHRPNTRQNICESLRVISVKQSSVLPDDGSHKNRNM